MPFQIPNDGRGGGFSSQHIQMAVQPGVGPGGPGRIEVFHNAGSTKLSVVDGIQAPSIMQAFFSGR